MVSAQRYGEALAMDYIWEKIKVEATQMAGKEVYLKSFIDHSVLSYESLTAALAGIVSRRLASDEFQVEDLYKLFVEVISSNAAIREAVAADLRAVVDRDPACDRFIQPLLFFKGFHALQAYRVSNQLWAEGRKDLALFIQNRISEIFGVDIHPAASVGKGILMDHATSIVVGETAIIEDDVSMLHEVTLGGTGKDAGLRHPVVRSGVLLGAGTKVLGRVEIGRCAKIGAGSVVLTDVPPHTTVVGVPARVVGEPEESTPALAMKQGISCGE